MIIRITQWNAIVLEDDDSGSSSGFGKTVSSIY